MNSKIESSVENGKLVSVITVVKNAVNDLEKTILSVLNQDNALIEYIIIDGNSQDGTLEIIKKYEHRLTYWTSEPDSGIYDAINKGIRISKGCFFYILNVGDTLIDLPLEDLKYSLSHNVDVAMFNVQLPNNLVFKSAVDFRIKFINTIHHQGAFYSNQLNIQYDLRYRVFSDFAVNQKLYLNKKKFIAFNKVISFHSLDGISNSKKHLKEFYSIINANFGIIYVVVAFLNFKLMGLEKRVRTIIGKKNRT